MYSQMKKLFEQHSIRERSLDFKPSLSNENFKKGIHPISLKLHMYEGCKLYRAMCEIMHCLFNLRPFMVLEELLY